MKIRNFNRRGTFGEAIDQNFTAENFTGNLGEILESPEINNMPNYMRRFLQNVYDVASKFVMEGKEVI